MRCSLKPKLTWRRNEGTEATELSGFNIPLAQVQENGFLFGGQAGYNMQSGMWVLGIEGDVSGTNLKGTAPCLLVLACTAQSDWIATLAGRVGVTYDRALFFLKGGAAWANVKYGASLNLGSIATFDSSVTDTRFGWMIGTGVEYAITQNLSAKIEYNYLDFGSKNYSFSLAPLPASLGVDIDQKIHLVKGGLNPLRRRLSSERFDFRFDAEAFPEARGHARGFSAGTS